MVISEVKDDNTESTVVGLPPGNYQLVGWDLDSTGRKFIDEICQIAGYTPNCSYSQYVMPYKDLNPVAMKRHKIRIVTFKKFRMLKNSRTKKMIKTKSEISALTEFLIWLESVKGDTDGLILIYHEPRKVLPAMLLESLNKYDLLDRFKKTVKGFANGFNIASEKCTSTSHTYSLRMLSQSLFEKEEELDNAVTRARLAFQIVQHLSGQDPSKETVAENNNKYYCVEKMTEFIKEFVQTTHAEETEYQDLKIIFKRQSTLRTIFGPVLRSINRREKQNVSPLRRILAENGVDYTQLQETWSSGKSSALETFIKETLNKVDEKKVQDLMQILLKHFEHEETSKLVVVQEEISNVKTDFNEPSNPASSNVQSSSN